MILFGVLTALLLTFVAWRTYGALDREARAQVRFFADRLLDQIEAELAELVRREENRAVDEYRHTLAQASGPIQSPLARLPADPFILGYFQNNPDGSFQTPLAENLKDLPADLAERIQQLQTINTNFNQRKFVIRSPAPLPEKVRPPSVAAKEAQSSFADRYLKSTERKQTKSMLGQEQTRVEEITAGQAMNLAQEAPGQAAVLKEEYAASDRQADEMAPSDYRQPRAAADRFAPATQRRQMAENQMAETRAAAADSDRFQVEVAPLQSVDMDDGRVFIFRRIDIDGRIYRQGFVLDLQAFLDHLLADDYDPQPIARYAHLTLTAGGFQASSDRSGLAAAASAGDWVAGRTFPAPFAFLGAEMHAESLPPSPARRTLTLALAILGIVMVAGLLAIYHSARAVLDLSERRSRFVSAVTHELKTPLTNIRMYIEMLDQGIAATPQREQEYLGILASESARLSGLIHNVLELSRLEQHTRRFNLRQGDLSDVLADVRSVMAESLAREGFELTVDNGELPVFAYDREVLVQVLINLLENSIKFGRHLPRKRIVITTQVRDGSVELKVTDSGPGIPKRDLKQVFDDFYRADNDLTRVAGGTGIGLALVKKFLVAMGGRVRAHNNDGPGCTIILSLPVGKRGEGRAEG